MEDEKTKVNENNSNNKNNGNESSKSSSNNDKYKSRKPSNDNNTKKSVPTRNNAFSRIKQGAKAAAFNKVANTIPGVSTLNNLNNIRKGVGHKTKFASEFGTKPFSVSNNIWISVKSDYIRTRL